MQIEPMDVTRDTFKHMSTSDQNFVLFDSLLKIDQKLDGFNKSCTIKHEAVDKKIKRSGNINRVTSGAAGLIGGFLATLFGKL